MPSAEELELTEEFQRRRHTWLRMMVPSMVLVIGSVCVGLAFPALPEWIVWSAFSVGLVGLAVCNRVANYRCPRCDTVPYGGEGALIDPEVCEECGLGFK